MVREKSKSILTGFSLGIVTWAVPEVAQRTENKHKIKVVIVTDTGKSCLTKDSRKWTIE